MVGLLIGISPELDRCWQCGEGLVELTLKAALYGIPMGRLAKTAKSRFAIGVLKARLWEISWMARKRFWFAVAPMM